MTTANQTTWKKWAESLQAWGLQEIAAGVLEGGAPLSLVGAQLVYLGQPVLRGFVADQNLDALAELLEEPAHTRAFIQELRREEA